MRVGGLGRLRRLASIEMWGAEEESLSLTAQDDLPGANSRHACVSGRPSLSRGPSV